MKNTNTPKNQETPVQIAQDLKKNLAQVADSTDNNQIKQAAARGVEQAAQLSEKLAGAGK